MEDLTKNIEFKKQKYLEQSKNLLSNLWNQIN